MSIIIKIITKHSIASSLVLLTICILLLPRDVGAGKGKVPVFMPYPIPVPVPMGGGGGGGGGSGSHRSDSGSNEGNKFHHHHHLHHQSPTDGEVKKIYLLHPVGSPSQSHNLFRQAEPIYQQQIPAPPAQPPVVVATPAPQPQQHPTKGDTKILPIVLIPPIAPMPPIQIQQPSNQPPSYSSSSPRMTLSPQFNNYLLSSVDPIDGRRTLIRAQHLNDLYQDHKTFSDYGVGGIYRRDSRSRFRPMRGRSSMDHQTLLIPQAPPRRARFQDQDYNDDYDYASSSSWRTGRLRRVPGSSIRRATRARDYPEHRISANNIKGIIDIQTMFDDEPPLEVGMEGKDSGSASTTTNRGSGSRIVINGHNINLDSLEQQDQGGSSEKDHYHDSQFTSASKIRLTMNNRDGKHLDSSGPRSINEIISYDREYPAPNEDSRVRIRYHPSSSPSIITSSSGGANSKVYVDDRELMQSDDELQFESVKSVTHANVTSVDTENNSNVTQPITTTIAPSSK